MNEDNINPCDLTGGDGRRLRRARSRTTVITSVINLFETGEFHPTAVEIVAPTNVSLRSVFRYFGDLPELFVAAIETQRAHQQLWELPGPPPPAPLTERAATVATHHIHWNAATYAYRQAVRAHRARVPALEDHIRQWEQLAWTHTATWFAPELARHPDPELVHVGLVAVVHPDHLDTLNRHFQPSRTQQAVVRAILALLRPGSELTRRPTPSIGPGGQDPVAS